MKKFNHIFLSLAILCCSTITKATNYYVSSPTGSNSNIGTLAQPFATIQKAANLTNAGDTVYIMDGTYNISPDFVTIVKITRSGTAAQPIVYKNYPGHAPLIDFNVWQAIKITNGASYIVVDGIRIRGNNRNVVLSDAINQPGSCDNPTGSASSLYNGNGIDISGGNPHHITIRNCEVFECGGAGIGEGGSDYVTIENNIVYNNSWYSKYGNSGISINSAWNYDNNTTDFKMIVRNNIVYGNRLFVKWRSGTVCQGITDGNGIIFDQNSTSGYTGRFLAENNVSYRNGGRGIHVYKSNNVTIRNNTTFKNCISPEIKEGEITVVESANSQVYNNIMYAREGSRMNTANAVVNFSENYNIMFNSSTIGFNSKSDMIANPMFVDTLNNDFRLLPTSPAINNGNMIAGQFSAKDITGLSRPIGFSTDMGAYEYPAVIARAEINIKEGVTDILDNTGVFDFSDVSSTSPKIVTFTIENIGDLALNLTGAPKVTVTGDGFSLEADAPATVSANGAVTFQVKLSVIAMGLYTGTVSIASDDATENPYNFSISGYGYDGTKLLQIITFNALAVKVIGTADFDPGAVSNAGLAVTYTSSKTTVATIVAGQIHIVGAGAATITASQAGDASTNLAKPVSQLLTVTPVLPLPGVNMVTNPGFDSTTTGWTFANKNGSAASAGSIANTGSTTNVGKVTITNLGTSNNSDNVQWGTNVFVVKDRNYLITFKANADSNRTIGFNLLWNASPYSSIFSRGSIALTPIQMNYGSYAFTSSYTGSIAFRFYLGGSLKPVYFDDVEIVEFAVLPITLSSFYGNVLDDKIVLNWITSSEINAREFIIERSLDGSVFAGIGSVSAKNALNGSSYDFTDNDAVPGALFYRLKSIDKDGSFKYSNIVSIKMDKHVEHTIKIFPNPVTDNISISYPAATAHTSVSIFLADGKKMGEYKIVAGSTQRSLDVSGLGRGQYIIVYKSGNQTINASFIK